MPNSGFDMPWMHKSDCNDFYLFSLLYDFTQLSDTAIFRNRSTICRKNAKIHVQEQLSTYQLSIQDTAKVCIIRNEKQHVLGAKTGIFRI